MVLLIIFGFVAGAATAVSPCVVPVLPIALSAGATGGRRRPLGVVAGLVVSFTFVLFALVYVIDALGLPNDLLRNIAIVVLFGFGIVLTQGLNRQIRLMAAEFGYRVTQLRRVRIINVKLGHLKPGQWRNLTEAELKGLLPHRTQW